MASPIHEIKYEPQALDSAQSGLSLFFPYQGEKLQINCRILTNNITVRKFAMSFSHPAPVFSRLFIFRRGGAEITTPYAKSKLKAGEIYLLPTGLPFSITYAPEELIYYHLHIYDITKQSIFEGEKDFFTIKNDSLYEQFLSAFASRNQLKSFAAINNLLADVLNERLPELTDRATRNREFSLLFDYLEKHHTCQVSVQNLADLYNVAPNTLSKRFKKTMHTGLKNFLIERSLTEIIELLNYSNLTVKQIADQLGYNDVHYLYRFFRKYTSLTPKEFRKNFHSDSKTSI